MYIFKEKQSILEKVINASKSAGADHVSAYIESAKSTVIRFAKNLSTQQKQHYNEELVLAVSVNQREAVLQSNKIDDESIVKLVERAIATARLAPINEEFSKPVPQAEYENTKTLFDSTTSLSLENCSQSIREMCDSCEGQAVDLYGNAAVDMYQLSVANSSGLFVAQPASEVKLSLTAKTKCGNGSSQYHISEGDWSQLEFDDIAKRVIDVAKMSRNPTYLEPGRYTVVLSPKAMSEYLMFMFWALDARMADNGQSYFSDSSSGTKLGQKLFGENITISSLVNHPRLPHLKFGQAFGSGGSDAGRVFSLGLPAKSVDWIQNGIVNTMRYSPYYAKQKGIEPIGYPFNLVLNGTDKSKQDLISSVEKGLLIESFWYVNPTDWNSISLTGLTRDGAFLIENGKITKPVNNFRFNDSPINSLNYVSGLSAPEKTHGEYWPALMPWTKIENFNMSAVSNAV